MRRSRLARGAARIGLIARAGFYAVLAYLCWRVAVGSGASAPPANPNGALQSIHETPAGAFLLVMAGTGFAAFALMRGAVAIADRAASIARRFGAAGQAAFYAALTLGIGRFLLTDRSTGSEHEQDTFTARLLAEPGGRLGLAAVGAAVLLVSAGQFVVAAVGGFATTLNTETMGPVARRFIRTFGALAICARAAVIAPIGALMILAAVNDRPRQARDLDELLDLLAREPTGRVAILLMAAGLGCFALYSLIEARYRRVHAGH